MECSICKGRCQKSGRQKNGLQKLYCGGCKKYSQQVYRYKACEQRTGRMEIRLVVEGIGLRGIARVLQIGVNTVTRIIVKAAASAIRPSLAKDELALEVDELWTYVGQKDNEYWVAYALDRRTRTVIDFVIGKRTKGTLKLLIDRLLLLHPRVIRTDKLSIYQRWIPRDIHRSGAYLINRIERKNLTLRTHLKRLSRRTIGFSRSAVMLESCLKLYFWR